MGGEFIELTDGTRLVINLSFGTLYYLQKSHVDEIVTNDTDKLSDDEAMEASARLIHAILRSSGRNVTFDEALLLVPADTASIEKLINDFKNKLEKYKKKEEAKANRRKFQSK